MYEPAAQLAQDPPSGPLEPLLQTQSFLALLPEGALELEGQFVQSVAPEVVEYLPLGHCAHETDPDDDAITY